MGATYIHTYIPVEIDVGVLSPWPAAQPPLLGRQWNSQNSSQPNPVHKQVGHPVEGISLLEYFVTSNQLTPQDLKHVQYGCVTIPQACIKALLGPIAHKSSFQNGPTGRYISVRCESV